VVALTGDLHIFASSVTTRFSTVFFSRPYIAQAWYVCALGGLLICHYHSVLIRSIFRSCSIAIIDPAGLFDNVEVVNFIYLRSPAVHSGAQTRLAAAMDFQEFPKGTEQNSVVGVGGPIVRQYLDDLEDYLFRSK
jgi:hypothetical protein